MPVFYSPVHEIQLSLALIRGSVFANNRTADSDLPGEREETSGGSLHPGYLLHVCRLSGAVANGAVVVIAVASEQASNLPLQMLLYFNGFYFPCWWLSTVFMLDIKVSSWTQVKK